MKIICFSVSMLFFCSYTSYSQDNTTQDDQQKFIVLYTLGESWDSNKSPQEQQHFKEHSAFLSNLRSEESIVIGARYAGTGMIVLLAKDVDEANEVIKSDVAIQNELFKVEIHPFSPFYKGCIE